jgi:hypothetical protein
VAPCERSLKHDEGGGEETGGEREIESKCEVDAVGPSEVMRYTFVMRYNKESEGERGVEDETAVVSRTFARQNLPETELGWLILFLLRNPSVL